MSQCVRLLASHPVCVGRYPRMKTGFLILVIWEQNFGSFAKKSLGKMVIESKLSMSLLRNTMGFTLMSRAKNTWAFQSIVDWTILIILFTDSAFLAVMPLARKKRISLGFLPISEKHGLISSRSLMLIQQLWKTK